MDVDIAIVGGGYSGLWAAYYLKRLDPALNIVVLEQQRVGYGASGRNGGWLMGEFSHMESYLQKLDGDRSRAARALITGIVSEVASVCELERIDCDLVYSGGIYAAARFPEQLSRAKSALESYRGMGFGEDAFHWLDARETGQLVNVRSPLGAVYAQHVAALHPAKLVQGLAEAVERLGVVIYEQTNCREVSGKQVQTDRGVVRAEVVVSGLEGYSNSTDSALSGRILPVVSRVVATEPLSKTQWATIGFAKRPVFSDCSRLVSYVQRSRDDRLIFGARGSYRFDGKPRLETALTDREVASHRAYLQDFFPSLSNVSLTHAWCGNLGFARRMAPVAVCDHKSGLAVLGGYGGEGVGASNLFGRTLADLILQRDTELSSMPWAHSQPVRKVLQRWEPEPLPWLAYRGINAVFAWEERLDLGRGRGWLKPLSHRLANWCQRLL
nr:FAD-binding oxidoreductase [Microbulbifer guangxiensis]